MTQPVVRLAAIMLIASAAIQMRWEDWRQVQAPVIFLLLIAAVIGVQLIPLPPAAWASLPGRDVYFEALKTVSLPAGWRPISLTPDLTLNSLLSVLPPLAVVLTLSLLPRTVHPLLVSAILFCIVITSIIGVIQISGDAFYFYDITNRDAAVGVFANRNHQAVFLATCIPLLVCWASLPDPNPAYRQLRVWAALCMAAAIVPLLLITGSRAGLALGVLGAVGAILLLFRDRRKGGAWLSQQAFVLRLIPIGICVVAVTATIVLARGEALQRLLGSSETEKRSEFLTLFVRMIKDYFPFGSGFGSFDSVFRSYEPYEALELTYLNHAHNDLAEILIEGGVLPLLLLTLFLGWFLTRSWCLWKRGNAASDGRIGRAASIVILILMLSSLVEYPLRTPLLSVIMAISCCWLIARSETPARQLD